MRKFLFLAVIVAILTCFNAIAVGVGPRVFHQWTTIGSLVVGVNIRAQGSFSEIGIASMAARKCIANLGPTLHGQIIVPSALTPKTLPSGDAEAILCAVLFNPVLSTQFLQIHAIETAEKIVQGTQEALSHIGKLGKNVRRHH